MTSMQKENLATRAWCVSALHILEFECNQSAFNNGVVYFLDQTCDNRKNIRTRLTITFDVVRLLSLSCKHILHKSSSSCHWSTTSKPVIITFMWWVHQISYTFSFVTSKLSPCRAHYARVAKPSFRVLVMHYTQCCRGSGLVHESDPTS